MARIWTLNIQRDQTIRFIESLFSIFKANNYAPRSHCIPIQGKRNQLNYMWELEKRHKHIQRQANEVRNDSIIGWIFIFLYMFGLWLCAAFKSDGWLDGWMNAIYIYMYVIIMSWLSFFNRFRLRCKHTAQWIQNWTNSQDTSNIINKLTLFTHNLCAWRYYYTRIRTDTCINWSMRTEKKVQSILSFAADDSLFF